MVGANKRVNACENLVKDIIRDLGIHLNLNIVVKTF